MGIFDWLRKKKKSKGSKKKDDSGSSRVRESVRGLSYEEGREELSPDKEEDVDARFGDFTRSGSLQAGKDFKNPALQTMRPDSFTVTMIAAVDNRFNRLYTEVRTGASVRNMVRQIIQGKLGLVHKEAQVSDDGTAETERQKARRERTNKRKERARKFLQKLPFLKQVFRRHKTSSEIADKGEREVRKQIEKEVLGDTSGKGPDEIEGLKDAARVFADNNLDDVREVGHTWIRLGASVDGQTKELSSFGFYPSGGAGLKDRAPGNVAYPDNHGEGTLKAKDYQVPAHKYVAAFDRAAAIHDNPPTYFMPIYNCTTFAKEVAEHAGVPFTAPPMAPKEIPQLLKPLLDLKRKKGMEKYRQLPEKKKGEGAERYDLDFVPESYAPGPLYEQLEKEGGYDFREREKGASKEREEQIPALLREDMAEAGIDLHGEEGGEAVLRVVESERHRLRIDTMMQATQPGWMAVEYDHPEFGPASYFIEELTLWEKMGADAIRMFEKGTRLCLFDGAEGSLTRIMDRPDAMSLDRTPVQRTDVDGWASVRLDGELFYVLRAQLDTIHGSSSKFFYEEGLGLYDGEGYLAGVVPDDDIEDRLKPDPEKGVLTEEWVSVLDGSKLLYVRVDDLALSVSTELANQLLHKPPPKEKEPEVPLLEDADADSEKMASIKKSELGKLVRDADDDVETDEDGFRYIPVTYDGEFGYIQEREILFAYDDMGRVDDWVEQGGLLDPSTVAPLPVRETPDGPVVEEIAATDRDEIERVEMSQEEKVKYRGGHTMTFILYNGKKLLVKIPDLHTFSMGDVGWLGGLLR